MLKRFLCGVMGHQLVPTGRRAYILKEFQCARCRQFLVANKQQRYLGLMFPRGRTKQGDLLTVFKTDADWEGIIKDAERLLTWYCKVCDHANDHSLEHCWICGAEKDH